MDGWTVIMNFHEKAASQFFAFFFFMSCVVVCAFFILNLTVAQMIMKYEEYSQEQHSHDSFEAQLQELAAETFEDEHRVLVDFIVEAEAIELAPGANALLQQRNSFIKAFFQKQKVPVTAR
jgi:tRNA C32,U32 (ribose-2'-O)-methylase TrmJ